MIWIFLALYQISLHSDYLQKKFLAVVLLDGEELYIFELRSRCVLLLRKVSKAAFLIFLYYFPCFSEFIDNLTFDGYNNGECTNCGYYGEAELQK